MTMAVPFPAPGTPGPRPPAAQPMVAGPPPQGAPAGAATARLREVASELEAAFLSEMLRHAGVGAARESFGGGIGEEQMTSMLRAEHARAIAAQGGIGLADQIFAALVSRSGAGA